MGAGSKASHLAYLGDATIGADVNVGAGSVTCNYDGVDKHATIIGDGAFIGTNSTLVAPVTIGTESFVAAGSTVTSNVEDQSLAVGRGKQRNIAKWLSPLKRKQKVHPKTRPDSAWIFLVNKESLCVASLVSSPAQRNAHPDTRTSAPGIPGL